MHFLLLATIPLLASSADGEEELFFDRQVRPVLEQHCTRCHGEGRVRAELDLVRYQGLAERVVPGDAAASRLYQLVSHQAEPAMPLKGPRLSDRELQVLREWIDRGAKTPAVREVEPTRFHVLSGDRESWAFRPLSRPEVPALDGDDWSRDAVDRFVLRKLREHELQPRPETSAEVLLRRASYAVLGLPPAEELHDLSYEQAIEQLLFDPHHGERWGRHWLDLARWAESTGYEADQDRPRAWPYRDSVIRAFAEDMPYDQFVQWQIAGDELSPLDPDAVALTGFLAAGPTITNEGGDRVKYDKLDDVVSTVGSAFLGLTLGCARCHDHKYDPVSTRDYYQLVGAFISCRELDVPRTEEAGAERKRRETHRNEGKRVVDDWNRDARQVIIDARIDAMELGDAEKELLRTKLDRKNKEQEALHKQHQKVLKLDNRELQKLLSKEQLAERKLLEEERNRREARWRETDSSLCRVMREGGVRPADNWLLDRGDFRARSEKISFDVPAVLRPDGVTITDWYAEPTKEAKTPGRRRAVAAWITDVERGAGSLLARVIVNRLWQHYFGLGIVASAGNFGTKGDSPSHPDLLEWLSCELVDSGWSLHHVHRLILQSATYRQGGGHDAEGQRVDPEAQLLWRRRPMRMEAEVWRDSVLAVAGSLNTTMYGPSVKPWIPTDAIKTGSTNKWPVNVKDGPATWRRSLYVYTKRSILMPMLEALDFPDSTASCAVRNVTTVAPAALLMMNNDFIRQQAGHFADRVLREVGDDPERQVAHAWWLALNCAPAASDQELSARWLQQQTGSYAAQGEVKDHGRQALLDYCQTLLGLNQFLYVE